MIRFVVLQSLAYFIATLNTAAIARRKYMLLILSDVGLCAVSYLLTKSISLESLGFAPVLGCMIGGAIGSVLALRLVDDTSKN